jgi:penicillin amidase
VTNGFVDQADMMLLHCDPENPGRYRRSEFDEWQAFEAREEVFDVRFGDAVRETFYITPSGVVLPQDLLLLPVTDDPDACIEARLVYMDGDSSLSALLRLNRAQTTAQAYEALRIFTGPSLNFTLADTDGDVGYVSAGRYYIREGDAATIIDYAPRDSMSWSPIAYEENPHTFSPLRGRIVTANQPAVGADYPHYLSDIWAAPFRAMRIHELLDATQTHDVESYLAMQRDTLSIPARRAVPRLLEAVPADVGGVRAEMIRVLRNWDYRFTPESPAPVVFLTWLHVFHEQVARDELGDLLWQRVSREALPPIVYQVLEGRHTDWCATLGEPGPGDCDALLVQSLDEAAARLEEALGPEPENWQWGQAAASTHPHQGFAGIPILDGMFSRTSHIPGGPDTLMVNYTDVRQAPHFPASGFASSLQAIYDLADLEQSLFMLSTGQSGHFRSPYYDNFLPRFAAGERFTIPTDRDRIEPVATLILRSSQSEQ